MARRPKMSFKDAFGKAKGNKKMPFNDSPEGAPEDEGKPKGKGGGFMEAAKNAKKKKSKK